MHSRPAAPLSGALATNRRAHPVQLPPDAGRRGGCPHHRSDGHGGREGAGPGPWALCRSPSLFNGRLPSPPSTPVPLLCDMMGPRSASCPPHQLSPTTPNNNPNIQRCVARWVVRALPARDQKLLAVVHKDPRSDTIRDLPDLPPRVRTSAAAGGSTGFPLAGSCTCFYHQRKKWDHLQTI